MNRMLERTVRLAVTLASCSLAAQTPLTLGPDCTVTVGNQTVIPNADGTFLVPNISIFVTRDTGIAPQLYRARATCVRDGRMITGQSDFFSLVPGGTVFSGPMFPSTLSAVPVAIELTALRLLLGAQESTQLRVTAVYANGTRRDVSPRSLGTTYLSMNSEILTVSENGLATSNNRTGYRQTAMVAALNEGNLATVQITVDADNDLDNDGMPNDYEDRYGLLRSIADGGRDRDSDGLTNFQEFQRGTIPNNSDTDEDGYLDGEDGDPLHPEEMPPMVVIISPAEGATLIETTNVLFSVQASDEGRLVSVALSTNTGFQQTYTSPPFEVTLPVPVGIPEMSFSVTALDAVPNVTTVTRTLAVMPDPLTTVSGSVLLRGEPIAGAAVRVFDTFTAQTDGSGGFSIPGVPTILGDIVAEAETLEGERQLVARSSPVPPVAGGVTDVGTLSLTRAPTISITDADGAAGSQATVQFRMDTDVPIKGWAVGFCHEGSQLSVLSMEASQTLLTGNDGARPDILILREAIPPGTGVVSVVVLSLATPAVLPPSLDYDLVSVTYRLLSQGGAGPLDAQICFCDSLISQAGSPPLETHLVQEGGITIKPARECGTITIR